MIHNVAVKFPAWIAALIVSAAIHAALFIPLALSLAPRYAAARNMPFATGQQTIVGFAIAWCVLATAWCTMVTKVLSDPKNRWDGLRGMRLLGIVAGLTTALNLVNGSCFYMGPALMLVVPILSYVAVANVSAPEETKVESSDPSSHG